MTAKKYTKTNQPCVDNSNHLTDVTITNNTAANEHTRASIIALAEALGKNADAIKATAEALKGGEGMRYGMYFGDKGD